MSVVQQDILSSPQYPQSLTVQQVTASDAARQFAKRLSEPGTQDIVLVGIAHLIDRKGQVKYMCLAQSNVADVLLIPLSGTSKFASIAALLCEEPMERSLASKVCLVGFGMAQIAVQISRATNLPVKGVDPLTHFGTPKKPWYPSDLIIKKVDNKAKKSAIQRLWTGNTASAKQNIALQAWLAACAGDQNKREIINAVRFDTSHLVPSELDCLVRLVTQSDLLEKIKPREVQNDFSKACFDNRGEFKIHNSRFKTKIRQDDQTRVVMRDGNNQRLEGTATKLKGKVTTIKLRGGKAPSGNLRTVKVVGLPEPTNSEKVRDELVCLVLAGQKQLRQSSFIRRLWFPRDRQTRTLDASQPASVTSSMRLNDSQSTAMRAMVGNSPIVIVHGPPGTGKTTTITAAAQFWDSHNLSVWIVAHSNVAVKNIAEKLFDHEVDFKILVSKDFHEEWHEHLYQSIEEKLIRSDALPKNKVGMERLILSSKVILCTLSMMLHPPLHDNGIFDLVPPRCLVIDEASQVNAFEFMPVFDAFRKHINKVCFFGDPLQLPPFGQDDIPQIQTIFDFKHLNYKEDTYFLNTQYRMPNPIARFISQNVYEGRLRSEHKIDSPECLAFIDVPRTGEKNAGTSTKNPGEVEIVLHLVKHYYRALDFCIITPYDAQRAAIQAGLKAENLPWETVFNVDSFQGNEADYVIVSLVRSSRPGFLRSLQRMNVMLTRCKRGLIIVSSQAFLEPGGKGEDTLLGKLVQHWQRQYSHEWIDWRAVASASVDLPGAPHPTRSLNTLIRSRNAQPHPNRSSLDGLAANNIITAQGHKKNPKLVGSNVASQKQPKQTEAVKHTDKRPSSSRNKHKAPRS